MTDIKDLGLSYRTYNCLMRAGINTLEKLRETSEEDLMNVRYLGRKTFKEVLEVRNNNPWIPTNKKLPSKDDWLKVWVTVKYPEGVHTVKASWDWGRFLFVNGREINVPVLAWKAYKIPEPYREVSN